MLKEKQITPPDTRDRVVFGPVEGKSLSIGGGFEANSFGHELFDRLMDPLVMVDHYTMSEPTFGAHPHAGMSAVSVLFEDSVGLFNNRDSLGNDIDLAPGDLYWLKAGSGAVHDEKPLPGSKIHGLQMFVNLPASMKHDAPESLHIKAADIPLIEGDGVRVRVVLGESNDTSGPRSPALPLTILDGTLEEGREFKHVMTAGHSTWLYSIRGNIEVLDGPTLFSLREKQSVIIHAETRSIMPILRATTDSQFTLVSGEPIREEFLQRGPFVMNTEDELDRVEADYKAGRLGSIA